MKRRVKKWVGFKALDIHERTVARLAGKAWRAYVLSRSNNQFHRWCEEHPDFSFHPAIPVKRADQLAGVRLGNGVELVELDGWEDRAADEDLLQIVRILKAVAKHKPQ